MTEILDEIFIKQPYYILYAAVVGVSIWKYPRYYDTPVRYLPILFMYTLLTEIIGIVIREDSEYSVMFSEFYYNNNWLIFNVYNLIFFGYLMYIYYWYLLSRRWKRIIEIGAIVFILTSLANVFLEDFRVESQLYSYTVGALLMILLSAGYLIQEYPKRKEVPFWRNLLVWLSIGILIFYAGYLPIKYIRHLIMNQIMDPVPVIGPIHHSLILFMYGAFLAGFLLMVRMRKVV